MKLRLGSLVRLAVVLLWGGLIAVLLQRSASRESSTPPEVQAIPISAPVSGDVWMGVYLNDKKVGYSRERFSAIGDGFSFDQASLLRISVMNTTQLVRVNVEGTADDKYALRTFRIALKSGVGDFAAHGRVEGQKVLLTMQMGKEESNQEIPLDEPIYLSGGVRRALTRENLEIGKQLEVRVFDPSSMQHKPMRVVVEAQESIKLKEGTISAWKVREELQGIVNTVWFDDEGNVLREQGPLDMVALRESAEDAVASGWDKDVAFDLMAAVAVQVKGNIPEPRLSQRLDLRLRGIDGFDVPSDDRQKRTGNRLVIETEKPKQATSFELPYRDEEWQRDLVSTPFLQTDHPRVIAAMKKAIGPETDAYKAAERLDAWVFQNLKKVPTASIPNAVQVLEMKEGDCNEHAVLYASLARAAGIPARVVAGVVFMEGTFLYHAWNEVWLGDRWVTVDPTFRQFPADATHVKLVEGGPEVHDRLLQVIGRIAIDVIEAS